MLCLISILIEAMASINIEISYGGEEALVLLIAPVEPLMTDPDVNFHGLAISQDFAPHESGIEGAVAPPWEFQVSPGEEIELAFQVNPYGFTLEEVHSFLFLVMMDWHQIPINGQPFLHFYAEHDENIGNQDRFTIIAPEVPGLYDISSLLVVNPTNPNAHENFFPVETGFRFTLEVIE